jgi:hypothetical protein
MLDNLANFFLGFANNLLSGINLSTKHIMLGISIVDNNLVNFYDSTMSYYGLCNSDCITVACMINILRTIHKGLPHSFYDLKLKNRLSVLLIFFCPHHFMV